MFENNEDRNAPLLSSVGAVCQPKRAWNMSPLRGSRRGGGSSHPTNMPLLRSSI